MKWFRIFLVGILFAVAAPSRAAGPVAAQVTVASTATLIKTGSGDGGNVAIKNLDASAAVYIGGATVTTSNGYKLAAGDTVVVQLRNGDVVYGIVASSTAVVSVVDRVNAVARGGGGGGSGTVTTSGSPSSGDFAGFSGASTITNHGINLTATTDTLNLNAELTAPDGSVFTPVLAGAGAGNVNNGVHHYKFTYLDDYGETQLGAATAAVTVTDASTNGQVTVPIPILCENPVVQLGIYRDANDGVYKLVEVDDFSCSGTYTDNTANASLGVVGPTTNTTMGLRLTQQGDAIFPRFPSEWGITQWMLGRPGEVEIDVNGAPAITPDAIGMNLIFSAGDGGAGGGSGDGGNMQFQGGYSYGTGKGGDAIFDGGQTRGGSQNGATAQVNGGSIAGTGTGNGGPALIKGGVVFVGNGNGGTVQLEGGPGHGMGVQGEITASSKSLNASGAATGKKVVCIDTSTHILYVSSTGTACDN